MKGLWIPLGCYTWVGVDNTSEIEGKPLFIYAMIQIDGIYYDLGYKIQGSDWVEHDKPRMWCDEFVARLTLIDRKEYFSRDYVTI